MKSYENMVHVRSVIIVNIIVIMLECLRIVIEFLDVDKWAIWPARSVVDLVKVRLEIEILSYIVQTVREHRSSSQQEST
jgi:hypothetical protein